MEVTTRGKPLTVPGQIHPGLGFFGEQHVATGAPLLSSHILLVAKSGATRLGLVSVVHSQLCRDLTGWLQCLSFPTGKSGVGELVRLWDD